MKIAIYGAFENGLYLSERLTGKVDVVGFIDSNPHKHAELFGGLPVFGIEQIKPFSIEKIVIAARSYKNIIQLLDENGLGQLVYKDPKFYPEDFDEKDKELSDFLDLTTVNEHLSQLQHTASDLGGAFSFGKNWEHFVEEAVEEKVFQQHLTEMKHWIEPNIIRNKRAVDIGCGSGLSAFILHKLECSELVAFDYDQFSVNATNNLFSKYAGGSCKVDILQGSILDDGFVKELGAFDFVHSWGVLHHTGDMKLAIKNATSLCRENGYIMIALYEKGPRYQKDLELKLKYNDVSEEEKVVMLGDYLNEINFRYQFELEKLNERGMNPLHDAIDWLGGYPYEVADYKEVISSFFSNGFELRKFKYKPEGGCSIYLFQKYSLD